MGDRVTCKCVLAKPVDPSRPGYLHLWEPLDGFISIPVRPVGTPEMDGVTWQYEERAGRLHVCPSLLVNNKFHTDLNWDVDYVIKPPGVEGYQYFFEVNPGLPRG